MMIIKSSWFYGGALCGYNVNEKDGHRRSLSNTGILAGLKEIQARPNEYFVKLYL